MKKKIARFFLTKKPNCKEKIIYFWLSFSFYLFSQIRVELESFRRTGYRKIVVPSCKVRLSNHMFAFCFSFSLKYGKPHELTERSMKVIISVKDIFMITAEKRRVVNFEIEKKIVF